MKVGPLARALSGSPLLRPYLIHTGQHYDPEMSRLFFEELELPRPDRSLDVGSGTHAQQTARVMERIEPVLLETDPAAVIVVGDVNSTLAATLVATKLGRPVGHVEAGLRSYDRTMPEEINRLVTDQLSRWLFTPSPEAEENLLREGIDGERIHFVGNIMIDTLARFLPLTDRSRIFERVPVERGAYALVTLHRPSNVDDPKRLAQVLDALAAAAGQLPILFPMHPRTRRRMEAGGLESRLQRAPGLHLLPPLGYIDFAALMRAARLVLTDSGGIQEETTHLGIPCLTFRPNTERPVTVSMGTNRVLGEDPAAIGPAVRGVLERPLPATQPPPLWDG
ncbi:MAG: UDP-N-acetylglucosamine 2-epimerase (non-hydrolyzing), partial [Candidatus Eisenbacteria bacterium]|nr:UDP-N-acetylglucosamine 2-epimerase (non-hydrolyzing) [Candidatus Eisenbacteria bacterium]